MTPPSPKKKTPESENALKIATIYALIGSLWIVLTSGFLTTFFSNNISLSDFAGGQVLSGTLVVFSSSWMLYLLVKGKLEDARRAAEALRLRDRAIEASVNAIIITSDTASDNLIEYVNPAFCRITGYSAEEALGRNWYATTTARSRISSASSTMSRIPSVIRTSSSTSRITTR
ncbi:MAG: PAS domain S-box protein [Proteobacteria bacterium]|nr:PAS domain S-box protein [Pseudomonadota bacterium]